MAPCWKLRLALAAGLAAGLASCGGESIVLPDERVPAAIVITAGDDQRGPINAALPDPIEVRVTNRAGDPVAEQRVVFTPAGAGDAIPDTALTDADGRASAEWVLGGTVGPQTLTARPVGSGVPGNLVATARATAVAGTAAQLGITAPPSSAVASGQVFPEQPVVQLLDASGNPVAESGHNVTAAITSGGGTLGGTLTIATDDAGTATFTDLSITGSAGPRTLEFSSPGLTPVASTPITVGSGAASGITIHAGEGQSATVGTAVPVDPAVKVTDGSGNPVAGVTVTFAVTAGGGSVSAASPSTDAEGIATVGSWVLGPTAGTDNNTLSATAPGIGSVTFTASGLVGGAGQLLIVTQPAATAPNGAEFSRQPVIQVADASGNPVSTPTPVTVFALYAGGGGALSGDASVATDANGRAVFTDLSITGPVGEHRILFSANALLSVQSDAIVLTPGAVAAANSSMAASPATITAGAGGATITVVAEDASGNPVPNASVTLSSSGTGNSFGDATLATGANGTASTTFSSTVAEAKTITALISGNGGNAAEQVGVSVTKADVAVTIESVDPSTSVFGQPITVHYALGPASANSETPGGNITVSDGIVGNTCSAAATGSCGFTPAALPGIKDITVTYSGDVTFSAGSATLADYQVDQAATVTTITNGAALSSAGTVVGGSYLVEYEVTVTPPGAGTPTGTVTVSDGMSNNTCAVAADQCSLTSTTTGAKPVTATYNGDSNFQASTSPAVTHPVAVPDTIEIITQPVSTPPEQVISPPPRVEVRSAAGDPLVGASVTVTLRPNPLALAGTVTVATGSDGTATFDDLRVVGLVCAGCRLEFTAGGALSVSDAFPVAP